MWSRSRIMFLRECVQLHVMFSICSWVLEGWHFRMQCWHLANVPSRRPDASFQSLSMNWKTGGDPMHYSNRAIGIMHRDATGTGLSPLLRDAFVGPFLPGLARGPGRPLAPPTRWTFWHLNLKKEVFFVVFYGHNRRIPDNTG